MTIGPVGIGAVLSAVILFATIIAGLDPIELNGEIAPRINHLINAPANELGDTLAGVAGALAFIWLAVAVFLQRTELELQRQELRAQRGEWEKMSRSLDAQARVFEDEQREREEHRSDREFDAVLEVLGRQLWDAEERSYWFWEEALGINSITIFRDHPTLSGDEKIRATMRYVGDVADRVSSQDVTYEQYPDREKYKRISEILADLVRLQEKMSRSGRCRAAELGIAAARDSLQKLLQTEDVWNPAP